MMQQQLCVYIPRNNPQCNDFLPHTDTMDALLCLPPLPARPGCFPHMPSHP
jgi:hypothetical protein